MSGQAKGVFEFDETKEADDVANILRRAQLAILNPSCQLTQFSRMNVDAPASQVHELKFSRNTVIMEITGADVDVAFIDLPGIISSTEKVRSMDIEEDTNDLARR